MKANWIKKRQTKYTAYAAAYILVIVAVLAAVNFLANRYNKSYDSTANKQFSLSDQTIKVVKNLKNDVNITYFDETSRFPQGRDVLDRYQNLSPKIHVNYVDPIKKPQIARAAGVRTTGTTIVENGPKKEEAKSLTEEEITGALIRALKSGERNACLVTGGGEHNMDDSAGGGFSFMKQLLERNNYKTRTVTLAPQAPAAAQGGAAPAPKIGQAPAGKVEVPKDCTVLVVGGPRLAYTQPQVDAIRDYVQSGGRALFMLDTPLSVGREEGSPQPELAKLLAGWGITLNNDIALDLSGVGAIFQLGPEVPLVTNYESHPITREMKEVATAFPLSRTMDVKSTDKATDEKLLGTGDNSVAVTNVSGPIDPKKGKKGPLTLAAAGSYNTGNSANPGRFVVVGSSLWATNSFLGSRSIANRDLFMNMVNWLTSDEDLISIRPKEPENRPLNITGAKMNMLFWLSVVLFPLGVVASGAAVWWKRR